jgi:hypothetical protein
LGTKINDIQLIWWKKKLWISQQNVIEDSHRREEVGRVLDTFVEIEGK